MGATETPAPCAPPDGTLGGSWHWLEDHKNARFIREWREGCWIQHRVDVPTATEWGWRYHSPVHAPEEVEALRRAAQHAQEVFQFYASEHLAAGKIEKAARNQAMADELTTALAPIGRRYRTRKGG